MTDARPTVTVVGLGRANSPADSATIRLRCQAERPTVADAVADANAAVRLVRAAVAEHGIEADRSTTSGVEIRAVERHDKGVSTTVGYAAEHRLIIEVAHLHRLGEVLTAAIAAAGDAARLDGVVLAVADGAELSDRARDHAWADAVRSATQLAEHAGLRLGSVLRIDETPDCEIGTRQLRAAAAMPVEPGGVEASVRITVAWELV
ncbi:SIMPL domain-containing protein [Demequina capsici]|uniref:SIMPL domain-containing protein n=1 Tax=Demequina capsici TaxID=3075620 RepID=A0AA96F8P0_9MICO|nr:MULTISPECIES: SIMPL domain-containing protein [unclassified Demequina]WNM24797.1 SIMPL domain-containing protein [Demequina sp. OYTSA14]WNM27704.1 SIMPL domain-containing protein [Demequina sp. PMTSA13]